MNENNKNQIEFYDNFIVNLHLIFIDKIEVFHHFFCCSRYIYTLFLNQKARRKYQVIQCEYCFNIKTNKNITTQKYLLLLNNYFRMSTQNSQIAYTPSEALSENNQNESNIDQLLSVQIITTSQSSSMLFNTTNMIPSQIPMFSNTTEHNHNNNNNLTQRQEGRRRRERREALRQQQQEEQRRRRELLQQQHRHYRPQRGRQRRHERYVRWQERLRQWEMEADEQYQRRQEERFNRRWHSSDSFAKPMDPKERWEQEQINELEGFVVLEQIELMQDELEQLEQIDYIQRLKEEDEQIQLEQQEHERSDVLQYITQLEDEIEQLKQIDAVQTIEEEILEEQQQDRNNEELIQLEQWEQIACLLQQ